MPVKVPRYMLSESTVIACTWSLYSGAYLTTAALSLAYESSGSGQTPSTT